ncbi:MAG: hypothetical protein DSZ31_02400 [Gammaproteobacteria bacterium]|nr:MAG: hypothetical protein DSZ31_02400 [Gammaproteobacteria bacterium]
MRVSYILSILLVFLTAKVGFAENEFLIKWNLFKDWKPTVVYKTKNNLGEVILKYKLFGEKKAKYRLFKTFSVPLDPEKLKNPSAWEGVKRYRKTLQPLLEGEKPNFKSGGSKSLYLFCKNLKGKYCPLRWKGKVAQIPLGVSLKNFTFAVKFSAVSPKEGCTSLEINSFGYTFLKVTYGGKGIKIFIQQGGGVSLRLPKGAKTVAFAKEGRELRIYSRGLLATVELNTQSLYLSEIVIHPSCLKVSTLAFYDRVLSPLEVKLIFQNPF